MAKLTQGRKHREPPITSDAPLYEEFSLDAYGHLTWIVGYNNDDDPEQVDPLTILALAEELTDEQVEALERGPRDCGDWLATVDCERKGNYVGYHVVINSDHAGYIDTIESGVYTLEEARKHLPGLLDTMLDVASEHLVSSGEWFTDEEVLSNDTNVQQWKDHLKKVLA